MPAEHDAALGQRILALASSHDDSDWFDVRLRAHEARAPRTRRNLRLALIGATILLGALVATPALGLDDRLVRLFEDGEPAPPRVQRDFAVLDVEAPPGMAPGVNANAARYVERFTIAEGWRVALWVAPRKAGGFCFTFEEEVGGCTPTLPSRLSYSVRPAEFLLFGFLPSRVGDTVSWVLETGEEIQIPLVRVGEPIDGGFFAHQVPVELRSPPRRPIALVVRDSDGGEVSRTSWASLFSVPAPPSLD